jgi:hypothetical protein
MASLVQVQKPFPDSASAARALAEAHDDRGRSVSGGPKLVWLKMADYLVGKVWDDRYDLAALLLASDVWTCASGDPAVAWKMAGPSARERAVAGADRLIASGWPCPLEIQEPYHRPLSSEILEEVRALRHLVDELVAEKRRARAM